MGSSYFLYKFGLWGTLPYGRNCLARTGRTGLMVRRDQTGRDEGGTGGFMVSENRSGVPLLDIEVRKMAVSYVCNQFHWCCRGHGVFVSVQKSDHNTLHTNPNF